LYSIIIIMASAFLSLVVMCLSMFFGSLLAGYVPLVVSFSDRMMKRLTIFGAGVLVGTALIVIIPEGIHTIYETHAHSTPPLAQLKQADFFTASGQHIHSAIHSPSEHEYHRRASMAPAHHGDMASEHIVSHSSTAGSQGHAYTQTPGGHKHEQEHDHDHDHDHNRVLLHAHGSHDHDHTGEGDSDCPQPSAAAPYIGASLAIGFIFQLLIDRWQGHGEHGHSHGHSHTHTSHAPTHAHAHGTNRVHGHVHVHDHHANNSAQLHNNANNVVEMVTMQRQRTPGTAQIQSSQQISKSVASTSSPTKSNTSHPIESPSLPLRSVTVPPDHSHSHSLESEDRKSRHHLLDIEAPPSSVSTAGASPARKTENAQLGLLVHAAVDGIALGAVSFSDSSALELIIFIAIILHKAPTAFGMSSYLLHAGHSVAAVSRQLLLFSAAAPAMALLTYMILGEGLLSRETTQAWLGLSLLFSAGSFLYVATVHVLPDIQNSNPEGELSWSDVSVLVAGMMLPMFITVEHSHG
jgi:solute carrier family 39 (zinc transporter), member 9